MLSVLRQGYANLEYVIIDGGSTDGSVEIIRKHEDQLKYWTSEPDAGQYDAINKGFSKTAGDVMAWINSDDKYTPWALQVVGEIFASLPEVEWLTSGYPMLWDEQGRAVACYYRGGYNCQSFFRGEYLPPSAGRKARGAIQQESTFWRRSLWERVGGYVDASLRFAADFELWARFFQHAELYSVQTPLGGFRLHGDQRSVSHLDDYLEEADQVLQRYNLGVNKKFYARTGLNQYVPERLSRSFGGGAKSVSAYRICEYNVHRKSWEIVTTGEITR
jgi:glycosyltransferase involved in cell wall biosynthesis